MSPGGTWSCSDAAGAAGISLLRLEPGPDSAAIDRSLDAQGPRDGATSFGQFETCERGVQVCSPARSSSCGVRYDGAGGPVALGDDAQEVRLCRVFPTAHTGADWGHPTHRSAVYRFGRRCREPDTRENPGATVRDTVSPAPALPTRASSDSRAAWMRAASGAARSRSAIWRASSSSAVACSRSPTRAKPVA